MQRFIAYVRSRPKTSIIALVAILFVIAGLWNDARQRESFITESVADLSFPPPNGPSGTAGGVPTTGGMAYRESNKIIQPLPPYQTAGETAAEVDQKIIKNGYLGLRVDRVSEATNQIGRLAETREGFVQNSSVTERGDGTYTGNITVRVPVTRFEETMAEIKKLATLVRSETSTGQDVTEQYTDLEAQLRNAQAQEQTYLDILKQARSVEDILKVQAQLGSIRGQIESLQGRIKYLGNQTSYSTINVTLEEEPSVRAPTREFRPIVIAREALQALVTTIQNIIGGIIWVVILWGGVLIPLGLVLWIIVKLWKRHAKRNPQA